jgi:glycosyltransferase involved in cell wall biosynthesis
MKMSNKELLIQVQKKHSIPFRFLEENEQMELLLISSFPNRQCGIATFSEDFRNSLIEKFGSVLKISVCAIENEPKAKKFESPISFILESQNPKSYLNLADQVINNSSIRGIIIQHEFGLFGGPYGNFLFYFLKKVNIPVFVTFHTVLPNPSPERLLVVQQIAKYAVKVVVMSENSSMILQKDYHIDSLKIEIIPHGVHLTPLKNQDYLKSKFQLANKKVLTTFGLLSEGKSIETAIYALPEIIKKHPDCVYLVLGKTHPEIYKREGEKYRTFLHSLADELGIANHVLFVNEFISLELLHDYLQLTDIYLFTSSDPFQAVSGTFAYAMGCGCPIISTKIPQAKDQLKSAGILIEFQDSNQLAKSANYLLQNPDQLAQMKINALQNMRPASWQNVAIQYMTLIEEELASEEIQELKFKIPDFNLNHFFNTTSEIGIIQFSVAEIPDFNSGYTLDDNARALIAISEYYELTQDMSALGLIDIYFRFIENSQQANGTFLNYVNRFNEYTKQNFEENLEDSNGRAIYALGIFLSHQKSHRQKYFSRIERLVENSIIHMTQIKSPRSIAFTIKGLYHYNLVKNDKSISRIILELADNLIEFYTKQREHDWQWFENSITYANAIIPESLLYAYYVSNDTIFKEIAKESFDFLLEILFVKKHISVISNRTWYSKGKEVHPFGEQPIDVAYTIVALQEFGKCFENEKYVTFMKTAFEWYLGHNHLNQIIYNPVSGGCCDGLEHDHVNINQGAESTVTYLMARVCIEKEIRKQSEFIEIQEINHTTLI